MPLSQILLPEFEREMAVSRKYLERLPEAQFDWRPHAKSRTLGVLAQHLSDISGNVTRTLTTDSFDVAPAGPPPRQPAEPASRAAILNNFDGKVAEAKQQLAAATDEQLQRPWTLRAGAKTIFTLPKAAVLRVAVFSHMIHHRAQLGVYLRMHDVPLPSTYGPSADEQPF